MGILFTKQQLEARGAIPSQIEMFSGLRGGSAGLRGNYGTYASIGKLVHHLDLLICLINVNRLSFLIKYIVFPVLAIFLI